MSAGDLTAIRGVVFDVGETLVDESRFWTARAAAAGVTPFTLMGILGALIERDEDHRRVWDVLGVDRPRDSAPIEAADLYPDAIACLRALAARGLVIAGSPVTSPPASRRSFGPRE